MIIIIIIIIVIIILIVITVLLLENCAWLRNSRTRMRNFAQ